LYVDDKKLYYKRYAKILDSFDIDNASISKILSLHRLCVVSMVVLVLQAAIGFNIEGLISRQMGNDVFIVQTKFVDIGIVSSIAILLLGIASFCILYIILNNRVLKGRTKWFLLASNIVCSLCFIVCHNFVDTVYLWLYQTIFAIILASPYYTIVYNLLSITKNQNVEVQIETKK